MKRLISIISRYFKLIKRPPIFKWKFLPPQNCTAFEAKKKAICDIALLLQKEPFLKNDVNFLIKGLEFWVFCPTKHRFWPSRFKRKIQSILLSQNFRDMGSGSKFCTDSYCPDKKEKDTRKYLKNITLICCDLHQDLSSAIDIATKVMFLPDRLQKGHLPPVALKQHFHNKSEYYRSLEKNKAKLNKFWNLFCYFHENSPSPQKTPLDHFYYHLITGYDSFGVYSCQQILNKVRSDFGQILNNVPSNQSCEIELADCIKNLYGQSAQYQSSLIKIQKNNHGFLRSFFKKYLWVAMRIFFILILPFYIYVLVFEPWYKSEMPKSNETNQNSSLPELSTSYIIRKTISEIVKAPFDLGLRDVCVRNEGVIQINGEVVTKEQSELSGAGTFEMIMKINEGKSNKFTVKSGDEECVTFTKEDSGIVYEFGSEKVLIKPEDDILRKYFLPNPDIAEPEYKIDINFDNIKFLYRKNIYDSITKGIIFFIFWESMFILLIKIYKILRFGH